MESRLQTLFLGHSNAETWAPSPPGFRGPILRGSSILSKSQTRPLLRGALIWMPFCTKLKLCQLCPGNGKQKRMGYENPKMDKWPTWQFIHQQRGYHHLIIIHSFIHLRVSKLTRASQWWFWGATKLGMEHVQHVHGASGRAEERRWIPGATVDQVSAVLLWGFVNLSTLQDLQVLVAKDFSGLHS
jgi:hypothetical protein